MAAAPLQSAALPKPSADVMTGTGVSDWTSGLRKTWDAITRLLSSSRCSSAFFALLPAFYVSGMLIYINTQLQTDLVNALAAATSNNTAIVANCGPYLTATVLTMTNYLGAIAGVAITASLASVLAIWQKWPGVLSFFTWVTEVLGHFLLVLFISLLCGWTRAFASVSAYFNISAAANASFSTATLNIMVAMLLPACCVWQLSASVMTRQRIAFSG